MLKDCIEIFEKEIENYKKNNPNGDAISFITDDYPLTAGTYFLLDLETGAVKETLEVEKNSERTSDLYRKFAKIEYLSMYLNSDKAVADKKIFSNNIYSFIVKKESVAENKINENLIDGYYDKILSFNQDKDTHKRKIYLDYEEKHGAINVENAQKARAAIKNFFEKIYLETQNEQSPEKEDRLAVFFDVEIGEYEKEGNRYVSANIYNKNKYNYPKADEVFGLPDNNMSLNDDKPFLENKSRRKGLPYAVSKKDIFTQKLFFDYLLNICGRDKRFVFFTENGVKGFGNDEYPDNISGFFVKIKKGKKGCDILDFAMVENRSDKICVNVENVLNIRYSKKNSQKLTYKTYKSLNELIPVINKILYGKSPKLNDFLRNMWNDWFYKGKTENLKRNFEYFSMEILKNTIENFDIDKNPKASEQFNLRAAIIDYFDKKETSMSEEIGKIVAKLDEKINSKTSYEIESDDEYYFAVGQLAKFFIRCSKSTDKKHSLFIPLLKCKKKEDIKKVLERMFVKYGYSISANWLKFNNLYGMICRYSPEKSINYDILTGGYLYRLLLDNIDDEEKEQ
ncbi:MAG: hypothetical protein ACI4CY_07185 [Candidatus Gastranaerophilaceae bacterium]